MTSLFRRVTRYPVLGGLDPHENRLTEVTAAVAARVRDMPATLVRVLAREGRASLRERLRDADPDSRGEIALACRALDRLQAHMESPARSSARIATQVVRRGRSVDLEVRLRSDPLDRTQDVLMWVEIKHGAPVHGDQLQSYLERIRLEPAAHRAVVVLAPRGAMPELASVPRRVGVVAWQQVAADVAALVRITDDAERRLLLEYLDFLKEEKLMDDAALNARHAATLADQPSAFNVIERLCELTSSHVERQWGKASNYRGRDRGGRRFEPGYWERIRYPTTPGRPRTGATVGWNGRWLSTIAATTHATCGRSSAGPRWEKTIPLKSPTTATG